MKPPTFKPDWSDEVKALYNHDIQEIWDANINRHVWNQYQNQLQVYMQIVEKVAEGRSLSILDVGCAQGTLALKLAERGHKVIANDLRRPFLDYAESRYTNGEISFICGNVLDCEIDQTFDLIFANQIIEHLVYPEKLVKRLKSLLRPGGRLIVTTPNWSYIKNDLPCFSNIGDPAEYESKQFTADADGHFFAYTDRELKSIFSAQNFRQVEIRFFETPLISGHMKVRYLHGIVPVGLLKFVDRACLASPLGRYLSHQLMVIGKS